MIYYILLLFSLPSYAMTVFYHLDGSISFAMGNGTLSPAMGMMAEMARQSQSGYAQVSAAKTSVSTLTANFSPFQTHMRELLQSNAQDMRAGEALAAFRKGIDDARAACNYAYRSVISQEGIPDSEWPSYQVRPDPRSETYQGRQSSKLLLEQADQLYESMKFEHETKTRIFNEAQTHHRQTFEKHPPKNPCPGCPDHECNKRWANELGEMSKKYACCQSPECIAKIKTRLERNLPPHIDLTKQEYENRQVERKVTEQDSDIQKMNEKTQSYLVNPGKPLPPEVKTYFEDQLQLSDDLSKQAIHEAYDLHANGKAVLLSDLANDLSNSVGQLFWGFSRGVHTSFSNVTQAMTAIYQNPRLVAHLYSNTMNYLTSAQSLQDIREGWKSYMIAYSTGNWKVVGEHLGRLGGDVLLALTGSTLYSGHSLEAFGQQLQRGIRLSPVLAKEVAEIDTLVANFKKAGFTHEDYLAMRLHRDHVFTIRDGYNADVASRIPEEITRLTARGESQEQIARSAHQMRRDIGQKYKDLCHPDLKDRIYKRNLSVPGKDELGWQFDSLVAKKKTRGLTDEQIWNEITQESTKTNVRVNQLIEAMK